jgi:branched-chain amino acid transport system permease protein
MTIAVIGGLYRIEGAWIGALVYTLLDTYTRGITDRFETWIGIVLLVILILSPDGLTGLAQRVYTRVWGGDRSAQPPQPSPAPAENAETAPTLDSGQVAG